MTPLVQRNLGNERGRHKEQQQRGPGWEKQVQAHRPHPHSPPHSRAWVWRHGEAGCLLREQLIIWINYRESCVTHKPKVRSKNNRGPCPPERHGATTLWVAGQQKQRKAPELSYTHQLSGQMCSLSRTFGWVGGVPSIL